MQDQRITFLYLSEPDMVKAGVLDASGCVEAVEKAFELVGQGDYLMGGPNENEHGIRIYFPAEERFPNMPIAGPDRRFLAMPAYLGGEFNICAAKWYGSNVENTNRGLPRSILLLVLNDPDTGAPLAVMSANLLSAMRTGAVPAVAAKYLTNPTADTIGVVGAGVINRATVRSVAYSMKGAKRVKVYDLFSDKAEQFCSLLREELAPLEFQAVDSIGEAVEGSDFITVATSGSSNPAIATEWVKEGAVLATSGAADLQEDLFLSAKVVVDEWKMHEVWYEEEKKIPPHEAVRKMAFPSTYVFELLEQGKINQEDILNLGPIVAGKGRGRTSPDERFIFISGGMAVQDAAWGCTVYRRAIEKGLGQELLLWDKPYWY